MPEYSDKLARPREIVFPLVVGLLTLFFYVFFAWLFLTKCIAEYSIGGMGPGFWFFVGIVMVIFCLLVGTAYATALKVFRVRRVILNEEVGKFELLLGFTIQLQRSGWRIVIPVKMSSAKLNHWDYEETRNSALFCISLKGIFVVVDTLDSFSIIAQWCRSEKHVNGT